jgi:hypothetical protein
MSCSGERVLVGLVLEQQVEQRRAVADVRGEQQVCLLPTQRLVDEGAFFPPQRTPVDGGDHVVGQGAAQKFAGALGVTEHAAEQGVVRISDGMQFVHGGPPWKKWGMGGSQHALSAPTSAHCSG